jgi:GNAT superfamily N-acetyltransferase
MKDSTPVTAAVPTSSVVLSWAGEHHVPSIARVWHLAWRDGHLGHVPRELIAHRSPAEFERRSRDRVDTTVVALASRDGELDEVVGFVTVTDDEVEQLFVDERWRGTGIATRLLTDAERRIARTHDVAWLAVVAGNQRARRLYERCGWIDGGAFDNVAEISAGATMIVPARRYTKRLAGRRSDDAQDSRSPLPARMAGAHRSMRDSRVEACFAAEK